MKSLYLKYKHYGVICKSMHIISSKLIISNLIPPTDQLQANLLIKSYHFLDFGKLFPRNFKNLNLKIGSSCCARKKERDNSFWLNSSIVFGFFCFFFQCYLYMINIDLCSFHIHSFIHSFIIHHSSASTNHLEKKWEKNGKKNIKKYFTWSVSLQCLSRNWILHLKKLTGSRVVSGFYGI